MEFSMEFSEIPWNFITLRLMEFHGKFHGKFHGNFHGKFHGIPWNYVN
jgi:hypothetical protein